MQIGNCWLKLDGFGSSVPLTDVSPAEVAILNENHEVNSKTNQACFDLTNVREEPRNDEAEIGRLRVKYVNAKNKKGESLAVTLYPGKSPRLPQKFEEVGLQPTVAAPKAAPTPETLKEKEPPTTGPAAKSQPPLTATK